MRSPWCAPGDEGIVLSVSEKDNDSIKVKWFANPYGWTLDRRYTFERRKNLTLVAADGAVSVVVA